MEKANLTASGNLLRFHSRLHRYYFCSPLLDFIREVSDEEGEFLETQCLPIHLDGIDEPEFLPHWYHVITICEDGLYYNWYTAKYPGGKWKFAVLWSDEAGLLPEYDILEKVAVLQPFTALWQGTSFSQRRQIVGILDNLGAHRRNFSRRRPTKRHARR